ncbi:Protein CNPPD1 [Taenia crassiceps]|uniref:Protein CNPPD1 n=1 Tax=Taenia crassiceps TaxID=6207 RepID=A0ABR4QIN9_9CEST
MARLVRRCEEEASPLPFGFSDFPESSNLISRRVINIVNSATERQLGKLDVYTFSEFLSKVTSTTLITALILVDKFRRLDPKPLLFYEITATELLIVATMAASKFLHDTDTEEASSNGTWAANFDIDLKALNVMELRFLSALHWNLFVSKSDFNEFVMNRFAVAVHSDKAIRGKSKRQLSDPMARETSFDSFTQKSRKIHRRWSLAKAMAMCAAAFLALSHPGVSMISEDSRIELLLSSSPLTSPVTSQLLDSSDPLSDQLVVPSIGDVNYTSPRFYSCRTTPNESTSSPVFERYLYYNSANAALAHPIVQNPNFAPTLPVVGVS